MIDFILSYLLIGVIWSLIFEFTINPRETNNSVRIRQILLWPIPASAWIIGFVIGIFNMFK